MLKVAVVGVGGWGRNHVRVMRQLAGEGLVDALYAVDVDAERLRWAERVFGAVPVVGAERAADLDVDAAVVATPTALHARHAAMFVSRGIATLVEKPFTATLEEALQVMDVAGKALVTTGFLLRFHAAVRYARERMDLVGRFLSAYGKRTSRRPVRPGDVGVVKDLSIHDVDLITFITGRRAVEVHAAGGPASGGHEEQAQIFARYVDASALLESNWLTPYKFRRLEITGDRGIFAIDFVGDQLEYYGQEGVRRPRLEVQEPLLLQDREFLRAAAGLGGEVVPREDVLYVLAFCEAAVKSMARGAPVAVDFRP